MLTITMCCGIPSSGKSTWAKQEIAKNPENYLRINNDDLRSSFNLSNWSKSYEELIRSTRKFLIQEGLRRDKNIIIDNLNLGKRAWKEVCDIAESSGKDVQVLEKIFYIPLDEAIERDAKRDGKSKVGEDVIKKWWKESGKEYFKHNNPRKEIFLSKCREKDWQPLEQNKIQQKAILCDLDGSIADITHRSPYDASKCLDDTPKQYIVNLVKMYYDTGHKIIFCSGREDKFKDLTIQWLNKTLPASMDYELFMRPSGNFEKDSIIKENIFRAHIQNKYFVETVLDDRLQVCRLWHNLGLNLLRIGDPDANF